MFRSLRKDVIVTICGAPFPFGSWNLLCHWCLCRSHRRTVHTVRRRVNLWFLSHVVQYAHSLLDCCIVFANTVQGLSTNVLAGDQL